MTQLPHPLLLGLLSFELTSFTNSFLWAPPAHLCLPSTSYDSHRLTTSFFGAPLGQFAFIRALLLFCRPVYHYSYHSSLIVFLTLLILLSSPLLYCWASSCHWTFFFLLKWASTSCIFPPTPLKISPNWSNFRGEDREETGR